MELLLAGVTVTVSLMIAAWQRNKARAANKRSEQLLEDLPRQLAEELQKLGRVPKIPELQEAVPVMKSTGFTTSSADVDNDGRNELLVPVSCRESWDGAASVWNERLRIPVNR